jgi:hypothetical protein
MYTTFCIFSWISRVICASNFTTEPHPTTPNTNETILCIYVKKGEVECDGTIYENKAEEADEPGSPVFWGHLFISSGLVLFAGMRIMKRFFSFLLIFCCVSWFSERIRCPQV